MQALRLRRADAADLLDRQWRQKGWYLLWRNGHQAGGLAQVAGNLGHKLTGGDAGGGGQLQLGGDGGTDGRGHGGAAAEQLLAAGDVQKRLIQRQALHQWGVARKDGKNLRTDGAVQRLARRHHHRLRAALQGGVHGHGGMHPKGARLVGGGAHHASVGAAHQHRTAAQGGVLALLHGGKKGVHIHMDNAAQRRCALRNHCHGGDVGAVRAPSQAALGGISAGAWASTNTAWRTVCSCWRAAWRAVSACATAATCSCTAAASPQPSRPR